MKLLTLEEFKNELEGDAQKRCAQQEKTIKEQAEMIRILRKDKDELLQKRNELLAEKAIQEFCPFDEFFMTAFHNGVNFVFDLNPHLNGYIISAHKDDRKEVILVKYTDIVDSHIDFVQKAARDLMEEVMKEPRGLSVEEIVEKVRTHGGV